MTRKQQLKARLEENNVNMINFEEDYQLAKDNYTENFLDYDFDINPEDCNDFVDWAFENWVETGEMDLCEAKTEGHATAWNKKLKKFAGLKIRSSEFLKDGLSTDYYIIQENGSLRFYNELRSLCGTRTNQYKNYWSNKDKKAFMDAVVEKSLFGKIIK